MIKNIVSLIVVAFLWGGTNPLIKRGSKGIEKIKCDSKIQQILAELKFLLTHWTYIVPFILNQCGSLFYMVTLQNTDLSLAVPVANSLSFLFTGIMARILGEKKPTLKTYFGMLMIIIGTTICTIEKM